MEQRCKNILQYYLNTQEYNTDYEIIHTNYNTSIIKYKNKNIILFYLFNTNNYIKFNRFNHITKKYNHNINFYYYNNKILFCSDKLIFFLKNVIIS